MRYSSQATEQSDCLDADIFFAERCVNVLVTGKIEQYQYDALVDLILSHGCEVFANSMLLALINKGDEVGAAAEIANWEHIQGRKP